MKAFLFAVSKYDNPNYADLPGKNDLYAVRDALIAGLNVSRDNINMYGKEGRIKKSDFINAVIQMANCSNEDVIFFYFSGHGGQGKIYLSDDGCFLQTIVDYIKNLKGKKIVILDCCHSGDFILNGEDDLNKSLKKFNDTDCAVLAACRKEECSYSLNMSEFTRILCDALTYKSIIKKGKKSLEDIFECVKFFSELNNKNNSNVQHPIFRSSLKGTIFFEVEEYKPYKIEKFYLEDEEYIIYEVEPLHTSIKRYAVKIILRGQKNVEQVSQITHTIVQQVKHLNICSTEIWEKSFKNKVAKLVFCYFAYDEQDILACNWIYRTTWVDNDQDKNHWYKINKDNQMVLEDVLVETVPQYRFIKNMIVLDYPREKLIKDIKYFTNQLIHYAESYIRIYREYINLELKEEVLHEQIAPLAKEINHIYFKFSNLPAVFDDIYDWSERCFSLASAISNFAIYFMSGKSKRWEVKDRNFLIQQDIKKYQEEFELYNRFIHQD